MGSIPAANAEEAMSSALKLVGPTLRYLPDGETGERDTWVVGTIKKLREHPDLEVSREGNFTNYSDQLHFKVRKGHRLTSDSLELGYLDAYRESRPIFDRLREEFHRPDLTFQVGVPGNLDLTLFSLGPSRALRYRRTFAEAIARDISQIYAQAGSDVLFQIEVPAEQVFVAKAPAPLRGPLAKALSKEVVELARRAPSGARFGVHLCLGDLGHRALAQLRTVDAIVRLGNAVARRWPSDRPLEYVHAPLAAGDEPPSLDPAFYRKLRDLRLPEGTRFVAGFLHEGRTNDELRRILGYVEDAIGHSVDVAASCGLGRRGREAAETVMRQSAVLCGTD